MVRRRSPTSGYSRSIIAAHPCCFRARPERSSGIRMFLHPAAAFSLPLLIAAIGLLLNLRRIIVVALRIFSISPEHVRKLRLLHAASWRQHQSLCALDTVDLSASRSVYSCSRLGFQIHNRLPRCPECSVSFCLSLALCILCDIICGI